MVKTKPVDTQMLYEKMFSKMSSKRKASKDIIVWLVTKIIKET